MRDREHCVDVLTASHMGYYYLLPTTYSLLHVCDDVALLLSDSPVHKRSTNLHSPLRVKQLEKLHNCELQHTHRERSVLIEMFYGDVLFNVLHHKDYY